MAGSEIQSERFSDIDAEIFRLMRQASRGIGKRPTGVTLSPPLCPRAMRLLLRSIAAHLHLAPAAALVLGGVEEEPAAMLAAALLDARQVGLRQHRQRRQGDGTEDRFDDAVLGAPDPGKIRRAGRKAGLEDGGGVDMRESVDMLWARPPAASAGDADRIDDLTQRQGAVEQSCAERRVGG